MLHNRPKGNLTVVKTMAEPPMSSVACVDVIVVDESGIHWSFKLSRFSHDMELRNPDVIETFDGWRDAVAKLLYSKPEGYFYYGNPGAQLLQDHYLAGMEPATHVQAVIDDAKAERSLR